ncbi:MAG TPA: AMP-binding protein [Acidimicrobiales bacterium]|nr:AMP-binding protein [Acidimicrobiales bacterium]
MAPTWSQMIAERSGRPDAAVINPGGERWTVDELLARAAGAARWLDGAGASPGAPLPALVPSQAASYALLVAGALTDRPLAPLSPRSAVDELCTCIHRLNAPLILTTAGNRAVADLAAARTGCRVGMVPETFPAVAGALDMDQGPDDIVAVVHTSGTTGVPKAVAQRQGPLALRIVQSGSPIELGPGSVYASASAFHHQAGVGLVLVAIGAGAALVTFPRFTPSEWSGLAEFGVTHATVVPPFIEDLLAAGTLDLPTLRFLQYGSAPLHPDTTRRLLSEHPRIRLHQSLGQTEGSPITNLSHEDHLEAVAHRPELLATVGRAVPRSELRIEGADGEGVGEITSRAAHYFAPDPDGWLRTGDLGSIDEGGFVSVVGRKNDAINRGGETVYPVEVERIVATHPKVRRVAVAGVPDRRLGKVAHAWVVPVDPGDPPGPDELRGFTRERLAAYKVPSAWWFVAELPVNPSGKLLRRLLVPPD